MQWLYQGKPFTEDMVGNNIGFVYVIRNIASGQMYIGKKLFHSTRTLPPLAGKKRRRKVVKSSNWQTDWSSSKILAEIIKKEGKAAFEREIISLHPDKREKNFAELAEQIFRNVLCSRFANGERVYYNENIDRIYYPSNAYDERRTAEHRERLHRYLTLSD